VTVSCYNASSAPGTNTGTSYTYNDKAGTNNTVIDGDKATVLSSLLATGLNMTIGASAANPSSSAQSVPGDSNSGPGGQVPGGDGTSASGTATGSGSGSASTSSSSGTFSQNGGGSSTKSSMADGSLMVVGGKEWILKGSLLAAVVAVAGVMAL